MTIHRHAVLASVITAMVVAAPALAQETSPARVSVAGGYSYLYDFGAEEGLPRGFFLTGTYRLTPSIALTGEFGGASKQFDFSVLGATVGATATMRTFLIGGRYDTRVAGLRLNGHVLGGAARESGGVSIFRLSIAGTETKPALQAGIGLDVPVYDRLGVTTTLDFRRIFSDSFETSNEIRFGVGLSVGFGRE